MGAGGVTIAGNIGEMTMGNAVLAKYGLVVYDKPQPHIPLEDLKLALGVELYDEFVQYSHEFVGGPHGILGPTPQRVIDFLTHKR
jgi:hypothetical protein